MQETNQNIRKSFSPAEITKLKIEAVQIAKNNVFAFFLRNYLQAIELEPAELFAAVNIPSQERFDAILCGIEYPTKGECTKIANALAALPRHRNKKQSDKWEIYTDGAFFQKDKIGTWSYVILKNGQEVAQESGSITSLKNSMVAEATAINEAVCRAMEENIPAFTLHSDSKVVIDKLNKGLDAISAELERKQKNKDFILCLKSILESTSKNANIKFKWVQGHQGNKWNEYCDSLCHAELWKVKKPTV